MAELVKDIPWAIFSLIYALLLASRGVSKKSLSRSGALAAIVVGSIHMYGGLQFGLILTAFYLSSSKLTKFEAELKKVIEEDYQQSSQRNATQVLANSLTSTILVIAYLWNENGDSRLRDASAAGVLGHFACCCADTWSSELGIVSRENPRLITTLKVVPKGTNGAISMLGTVAGAAGGFFMGLVFWLTRVFVGLIREKDDSNLGIGLVVGGFIFGLLGTLLDSLLGGTLQYTGHSRKINRIVNRPGPEVTHLSGRNVLSNEAVNFFSSAAVTGFAAYWATWTHSTEL